MHALKEFLADAGHREALARALEPPFAMPVIRCAKIKVTARCNLRCAFCHYWRMHEPDELSTEDVCRVLRELAGAGCAKVHFSGGEATLRPDICDLVRCASGLGMKANLTTNGTLLDRERALALAEAGADGVSLSLDAPDAKAHDALRGVPGAFRRTLKGIEALSRAREKSGGKMKLRLNMVLTRHNYRHLPEMIEMAAGLGMVEVHPMPVDERGDEPAHRLSEKEIRAFNTYIAPIAADARRRAGFSLAPEMLFPFGRTEADLQHAARGRYARGYYEEHVCYAPWLHLFIGWAGDVFLCCMARGKTPPLGNIRAHSVTEVFNGDTYRSVRAQFLSEMPKVCHRCDMFLAENRLVARELLSPA